jgi:hypothetical protein
VSIVLSGVVLLPSSDDGIEGLRGEKRRRREDGEKVKGREKAVS